MSVADAVVMLMVAAGGADEAERIAALLVEGRLAACVQTLPMRSTYRWEGRVECAEEVLLLVKTSEARAAAATDAIRQAHSYQLPEILMFRAEGGLPAYLAWVAAETA